jgi:hypothetical protein
MQTGNLLIDAQAAFARQRRGRRRDQALGWLTRRSRERGRLAQLDQALASRPPAVRRRVGLQAVQISSIVGTAERTKAATFDGRFRPPATSRERWERLWMAARKGCPLPPISVMQLGDQHFVVDGHHRVSVAHALGMSAIDAEVTRLVASPAPASDPR